MYVQLEFCVPLNSKENCMSLAKQLWLPNKPHTLHSGKAPSAKKSHFDNVFHSHDDTRKSSDD